MKKVLLTLAIVCLTFMLNSQTQFHFSHYTKTQGLHDNYILYIFEDSRGFMWFGTRSGLRLFDGKKFKEIVFPQTNETDLNLNFISSIAEDKDHNLWLGCNIGVLCYNYENNSLIVYKHDIEDSSSISNNYISDIVVTSNNDIWIATRNGLNFFDIQTKTFKHYFPKDYNSNDNIPFHIHELNVGANNEIFLSTMNFGLNVIYDKNSSIDNIANVTDAWKRNTVNASFVDSKENIWAVSQDNGIFLKSKNSDKFEQCTLFLDNTPVTLSSLIFSCINEDNNGNIWFGTFGDGLYIVDPLTFKVIEYSEDESNRYRLQLKSIDEIFRDKYNNMWIATHGGGVSMYSPIQSHIKHIYYTAQKDKLPGNIISCFYEDSNGRIWIGIDGNGFCEFDMKTKTFKNYTKDNGLSSNAVLDIVEIDNNRLAISTWSGGLNIFDIITRKFEHYYQLSNSKHAYDIYNLYFDKSNNCLWCGTFRNGAQVFDLTIKRFLNEKELINKFSNWNQYDFISKVIKDKKERVWAIHSLNMLSWNDTALNLFASSDSMCISTLHPFDTLETSDSSIWLGCNKGLLRYNETNKCFNAIIDSNYNPINVLGIIEDKKRNIWFTTPNELFRYNSQSQNLENISIKWGMPDVQFFNRSVYRSSDGHLFFGAVEGFIMLHEDSTYNYNIDPPVFVTELKINNIIQKTSPNSVLSKDISFYKDLILNYNQSFLTFDFVALNFIDNTKSKYKYKLEGFDKDWNYVQSETKANYTNIPPGEYIFKIQTTNSDGIWVDDVYKLNIKITPPWWKTLWFNIALLLIIAAIIVFIIKYRERSIKEKNKHLEEVVAERTIEIETVNISLQKQNETLQHQKDEIQTHLNDLKQKQMVIQMKNDELQETVNVKDKLITIIAHDFKNPLTTLTGFANILLEKRKDNISEEKTNKYFDSIAGSAKKVLEEMDKVLQWSSAKEENVKYAPKEVNLETIILDVLSLINESALRKNITIRTIFSYEHLAFIDARMISTVFRNVLTNSIKFSNEGSEIRIFLNEHDDVITATVSDDGVGMPQEKIDMIMLPEKATQVKPGSGFGLQIIKNFVAKNSGTINVISEPNNGTEIIIDLPKGETKIRKMAVYENTAKELLKVNYDDLELDSMPKMLVVDDNEDVALYLKEIFSDSFSVYTAYNGQNGYDMAQDIIPDIILSDVDMPLLGGNELCRMLKANMLTSHIPIILVSAKVAEADQLAGLVQGADDYVIKPFNVDLLKQKVFNIISVRRKLHETQISDTELGLKIDLPESVNDKLLKRINEIVLEHISKQTFSVEMLASESHMSRSQLYRKFKGTMGISPMDYIKNVRLQKAMEMLKTGKYRISEVSDAVGFSDSAYFSRCFTSAFGSSPSSFMPKKHNK